MIVDGEIKEGYLLRENYFMTHFVIKHNISERLYAVLQNHVDLTPIARGSSIAECPCCATEDKQLYNYCPVCNNWWACSSCATTIMQSCLLREVHEVESPNLAVIFRCPNCRSEIHLDDIVVSGNLTFSMKQGK